MTKSKKLRVGVVGVGHLGYHHARILSRFRSISFSGIFDVDSKRVNEVAKDFKLKAYTDLDLLIKDSDAISIVVPTVNHFEVAKKCLEKGKDVFIEKPITQTVKEANILIKLALKTLVGILCKSGSHLGKLLHFGVEVNIEMLGFHYLPFEIIILYFISTKIVLGIQVSRRNDNEYQ